MVRTPFHIAFHANLSRSRFAVARKLLSTGSRYEELNPVTELIQHVSGLRQTPSDKAVRQVNRDLVAALATPDGSPRGLALAVPWISGLDARKLSEEDAILARRIVGDLRVQDIGEALQHLYPQKAPIEYRPVLVQRIIASETNAKDRSYFAHLLSRMPAGTFADMTEKEWQIITDPMLRKESVFFIERLADLGQPGVKHLMMILRDTVDTIPQWHLRKPKTHAVCRGLARLGVDAAEAVPLVKTLLEQKPRSPLTNSVQDAFQWRVAAARMGLAIEDLPYPSNWSEPNVAKMREKVRQGLADFDPDDESR